MVGMLDAIREELRLRMDSMLDAIREELRLRMDGM